MTPASHEFGPREVAALVTLSSFWGLSFLFIELALEGLSPLWIVAGRTVIGGAVLLVILALRGRGLPRGRAAWRHLLVLGTMNNAVPWAGIAWAQQWLPSGLTALLMALVPTSTLLVSAAVGLDRFTRARIAGLLVALAGVALIVGGDVDEPERLAAVGVVVLATVLYALGAVYAKRYVSGTLPPLSLAAGQVVSAALVTLPIAVAVEGLPPPGGLGATVIGAVTALGTLGTGLAFLLFYVLIERVGPTSATMTTYLIPLVAVVAGAVVLGERLAPLALAGGAAIVVGIWLAQRTPPPLPVDPEPRLAP